MAVETVSVVAARIERTTFATSRLLDFMSEKELTFRCGYGRQDWPLVIGKELIDNALDACEEQGIAPELSVEIDESRKVIPNTQTLAAAWRRGRAAEKINKLIEKASQQEYDPPPDDLAERVRVRLQDEPELSWGEAVILEMDGGDAA